MNINLPFNYDSNVADIDLILMSKSYEEIDNIGIYAKNFDINIFYNKYDEFSFDVVKELNGEEFEHWDDIIDFKVVYIPEMDEHFSIRVSIDDGDETIKHVTCTSLCEDELSNSILYNIEINTESDIARDDYVKTVFYNASGKNSLLHKLLSKVPQYTIGHVDTSLKNIQRQFSFDSITIYDAMSQVSEDIGCLFKFNTRLRQVNVYDLKNYCVECGKRFDSNKDECSYCGNTNIIKGNGNDTSIFISKENLSTMASIQGNTDSFKNCLRIKTGDSLLDATIRNINSNGTEYIYYLNDDSLNDMPQELVDRINQYKVDSEYYMSQISYTFSDKNASGYNNIVNKYNGNDYRYYEYNIDGEKELKNRNFKTATSTTGYEQLIEMEYDLLDLSMLLSSGLFPYQLDIETTIDEDVANISFSNISPVGVTNVKTASTLTVEGYIKKYASIYLNKPYSIEVNTTSYTDYNTETQVALWSGTIKISTKDESESRTVTLSNVRITSDPRVIADQKLLKELKDNDSGSGLSRLMSLDFGSMDNTNFINELKYYSESRLEGFYKAFEGCLNILQELGYASMDSQYYNSVYLPIYEKKRCIYYEEIDKDTQTMIYGGELYNRRNEISVIDSMYNELIEQIQNIQNAINFENYLGEDLLKVFSLYKREDIFSYDSVTSDGLNNAELIDLAKEVIVRAKEEIVKTGYIQKTITSDLINFLNIPEFSEFAEEFNLGNWIYTEVDNKLYYLRLLSVNFNINENGELTITPTFSTIDSLNDELSDLKDIIDSNATLSTSIGEIKKTIGKTDEIDEFLRDFEKGLNLTNKTIINNANKITVQQDSNGILVRSYDDVLNGYKDEQLKIINSTIAITDDNWRTSRTAIGKYIYIDPQTGNEVTTYGVMGDTIVGNLLIGHQLQIYDSNNQPVIYTDSDGNVTIGNNNVTIKGDVRLETNKTLRRFFDFSNPEGLVIGLASDEEGEDRPYKLVLNEERISFRQNDLEIAYFSGKDFNITSGYLFESLRIGNFAFLPRSNGSLDFKKVAG